MFLNVVSTVHLKRNLASTLRLCYYLSLNLTFISIEFDVDYVIGDHTGNTC